MQVKTAQFRVAELPNAQHKPDSYSGCIGQGAVDRHCREKNQVMKGHLAFRKHRDSKGPSPGSNTGQAAANTIGVFERGGGGMRGSGKFKAKGGLHRVAALQMKT